MTDSRRSQAAWNPVTRILPPRKLTLNSRRRTHAILAPSTASRPVKPTTKQRVLGKHKEQRNTAADLITAALPSARPQLQRTTQQPRQPASDKRMAAPLLPRQSRLESQHLTNAAYAPHGRQRPLPLPKAAKLPEPARASKRMPLRGTRRAEPAERLPPAEFPSQRLKSKPAPLSTRQRKSPARPPATHPFHLFGPLVARVLRQKCAIRRIACMASRRTRRKERRRQRLAYGTRKLWDSKVSGVEMVPTSFRSGRVPTNVGGNDSDDVECHGLCTRQALVQQFRADVLPSLGPMRLANLDGLSCPRTDLRQHYLVRNIRLLCPSYHQRSHPKYSLPVLTTPFTCSKTSTIFVLALSRVPCMYQQLGRFV